MPRRLPRYCVEDVDRYGKVRVYLRVKGRPKVNLAGTPWTASFMAEYEAALHGHRASAGALQPHSWEWLCREYFKSHAFTKKLTPRVQLVRRRILVKTFEEPLKPGSAERYAEMPVRLMSAKAVRVLRDRLAHVPESANARLKAIRQVFIFGIAEELIEVNPARDAPYIRNQTDGFYTWSMEDVLQYIDRHPLGTKAHLAMAIFLFTGVRRSDAAILGRQHIKNGWIRFKPMKTQATTGAVLNLPVLPELQRAIDAGPIGDLTLLVTEFGRPFTSNGLGNKFKDWCRQAGLPICSAHGLRKAGAVFAAENGATDAQLQAIYGWSSSKMPALYRKMANQKKLAGGAMSLIRVDRARDAG